MSKIILLIFTCLTSCMIFAQSACLTPINLTLTAIGNDYLISWEAGGSESEWILEYGPENFVQGTGTIVNNLTSTSTLITGLPSDAYYDFHIQANCGSELSGWESESFFLGYCKPFSEDNGVFIKDVSTSLGISNITNLNSGYALNGYQYLTAQSVQVFVNSSFNLTVTSSDNMGITVWVDWNNNLVFDANEIIYTTASLMNNFTTNVVMPTGTIPGDYRMRIIGDNDILSPVNPCTIIANAGETEDYLIKVLPEPTCFIPADITLTASTPNSLSFEWESTGNEDSWIIEYGVTGFVPGNGTIVNSNVASVVISNLQGYTTYDIYVKADCGNSDVSYPTMITATTNLSCGSLFTDGPGNYSDNQNQSWTVCAGNAQTVMVEFTGFELENGYDYLKVYKGFNLFETYTGNALPDVIYSDAGGCLKFEFTSDGGGNFAGWDATIMCKNCVPVPGVDAAESVCSVDEVIDLNTIIQTNEEGVWKMNVMSGLVSENGNFDITYLAAGVYHPYYVMGVPNVVGCTTDTIFTAITVLNASNSGEAVNLSTCNFGPVYLFDGLEGAYHGGGNWYDSSNQLVENATVWFDNESIGNKSYTYKVANGVCPEAATTITIDVTQCMDVATIDNNQFALFPNPTTDAIFIQYDGVTSEVEMIIADVKGTILLAEKRIIEQNSTQKIELDQMEIGMYFIQLNTKYGKSLFKVIKK